MPTKIKRISPLRTRGCINFKSGKPKVKFSSFDAARRFLRENGQISQKEPYSCDMCGHWHNGRILKRKK